MEIHPIAYFRSPFKTKFGIPKQSGLVEELTGRVVLEPQYSNREYIRGIEEFDYLWLIWEFSANSHQAKGATVRPPLLGGNKRMGVFATRSPFRPNGLGLSSVRLSHVDWNAKDGVTLYVKGADLMDGTPIYDIKPYIEYADSHAGVRCGFVDDNPIKRLQVIVPEDVRARIGVANMEMLIKVLELDPRPRYQNDAEKVYGMAFGNFDIRFTVEGEALFVKEACNLLENR